MDEKEAVWEHEEERNCCFRFRHVVLIFSCMAMFLGIVLLVAGSYLHGNISDVTSLKMHSLLQQQTDYQTASLCRVAIILLLLSGCLFALDLLPACAAVAKDSLVFMSLFTSGNAAAVAILILALVLSVLTFTSVESQKVDLLFNKTLIQKYASNTTASHQVTIAWNQMQILMKCCGVDGDSAWKIYASSKWYQHQPDPGPQNQWVPSSCCDNTNATGAPCLVNTTDPGSSGVFQKGCKTVFTDRIRSAATAVLGLSASVGAFTLYGQCLICIHCCMIRQSRKKRKGLL